ncbi:MAG: hypothetical protein D6690_05150 [Nitrospirae bacterium]|nr:MAG: hypothetical protein D6690_05150 [Nitrospirota bacterium]
MVHGVVLRNRPDRDAYLVALQGHSAPILGLLPHREAVFSYKVHDTVVAAVSECGPSIARLSQRSVWYYRRMTEFVLRPAIEKGLIAVRRIACSEKAKFFKIALEPLIETVNVYQLVQRDHREFRKYTSQVPCIVRWSPDIESYLLEALRPADPRAVKRCELYREAREAVLHVAPGQIGKILGPGGMNVALAAKLTRYRIDVKEATAHRTAEYAA